MLKGAVKILAVAGLVVFVTGCATSEKSVGNIKIRRYTEDRLRVDQEKSGNAGYVYGKPPAEEKVAEPKKTRRLYYVEFSKETPGQETTVEEKDYALPEPKAHSNVTDGSSKKERSKSAYYSYSEPAESAAYEPQTARASRQLPDAVTADEPSSGSDAVSSEQYTIQENDTLQKISHKFYGSYGKWNKIYEANKDVLKDPNRIIPGKKITIPTL